MCSLILPYVHPWLFCRVKLNRCRSVFIEYNFIFNVPWTRYHEESSKHALNQAEVIASITLYACTIEKRNSRVPNFDFCEFFSFWGKVERPFGCYLLVFFAKVLRRRNSAQDCPSRDGILYRVLVCLIYRILCREQLCCRSYWKIGLAIPSGLEECFLVGKSYFQKELNFTIYEDNTCKKGIFTEILVVRCIKEKKHNL